MPTARPPSPTDTGSATPRRVLVLGAQGHLGAAAVRAFAEAGWSVIAQSRRALSPMSAGWPAGVQAIEADALDTAALLPAARGVPVIVNALNPDYTRWAELWPPLHRAVLALAEAGGATLMLPGNVYNFGRAMPAELRADTPFAPDHAKARQRIALEAAMAEAAAAGRLRSIVVRAGDFLGATGTWIDLGLGLSLPRGRFLQMGPADRPHAWAYLPDLARSFVAAAEARDRLPAHAVLHHEGLTLTGAELESAFAAAWAEAGGGALRRGAFPWWAIRLAALVPGRGGAMPRALLEMRHLWDRPHRLVPTPLPAPFAMPPATPLPEVMRACVAALPAGLQPRRHAHLIAA